MNRVLDKSAYIAGTVKSFTHDGNKEWITILATTCVDGSSLATSIIYAAESGNIYHTWVDDIPADEEDIHVAATPTGWTNDDYGLAWLTGVFDRYIKPKARRKRRLLILDGHGSHVTMKFIDCATQNRILLAIFPPHSTHSLQPLDVGLFGPLSTAYSTELSHHQHAIQGHLPVKKADFYTLFKSAYAKSFTERNIISSFKATGIWPMIPSPVLDRLQPITPPDQADQIDPEAPSRLSPADWARIERLLRDTVKVTTAGVARKLTSSVHRLSTQNKLQQLELEGLRASLATKNKRMRYGKPLLLPVSNRTTGGAIFYSPRTVRQAKATLATKEAEKHQKELDKAESKKQRQEKKLQDELFAKKRAEERVKERQKKDDAARRAQDAAEKRAERKHQREARDHEKTLKSSHIGKHKASRASPKQQKRQKVSGDGAVGGGSSDTARPAASPEPARTTSCGRTITLPIKLR